MDRNPMKTYSTGEFAKYFGIKKDTLFYYDRIELFSPAGVSDNGYRYYTTPQLDTFWALLYLRELHVPIKELKQYFSAPSAERLSSLAQDQLKNVEQEIFKLQNIQQMLRRIVHNTEEIKHAPLNEVFVQEQPEEDILLSKRNESKRETSLEEWFTYYDRFVEESGCKSPALIGSVIALDDLMNCKYGRVDRLYVHSASPTASIKTAGRYAVLYYQGTYASIPNAYPFLLSELKRQGLQPCSDAYEEYLVNNALFATSEDQFITKISIAVQ